MSLHAALALGLSALLLGAAACGRADAPPTQAADTTAAVLPDSISVAGFSTPESVLYDDVADVYLVSNINGEPLGRDDNGFISRVAPDGTVQQLKWIDGAAAEVTLNAPKGMAIIGDTLFVSDIDSVRAFSRTTGAMLGARAVPGSTFLNDLAAGGGVLYVSDSGLKPDFSSSGTDAVYRFEGNRAVVVVRDTALKGPNGLVVGPNGVTIVPFGAKTIMRVAAAGGAIMPVATLTFGQLDGVVHTPDGGLLVSSWETKTVYHIDAQGQAHPVVQNVESPADIGFDTRRNRVLIPSFMKNTIEIRAVR
ncbi:MAG: SMP-30/gluconolactonase/LRE family protein [Longimicrobiales bacterium]